MGGRGSGGSGDVVSALAEGRELPGNVHLLTFKVRTGGDESPVVVRLARLDQCSPVEDGCDGDGGGPGVAPVVVDISTLFSPLFRFSGWEEYTLTLLYPVDDL